MPSKCNIHCAKPHVETEQEKVAVVVVAYTVVQPSWSAIRMCALTASLICILLCCLMQPSNTWQAKRWHKGTSLLNTCFVQRNPNKKLKLRMFLKILCWFYFQFRILLASVMIISTWCRKHGQMSYTAGQWLPSAPLILFLWWQHTNSMPNLKEVVHATWAS